MILLLIFVGGTCFAIGFISGTFYYDFRQRGVLDDMKAIDHEDE